ncbi:MAG TPA: Ppx/GppA phosphatase family protein [Jatrophihabitans sp.]|nr:Ppx/GppA phosphatase family protein [Jatrophihabitans sp.]
MTRVAGIDCGTNSIRLVIADLTAPGGTPTLTDLHREMRVVRLGEDVDRTGRLAPQALARTRVALADYAAMIEQFDVERVRMVATSATRDAANADEFVTMVVQVLGVEPEVITGKTEAQLSFTGAVGRLRGLPARVLVADIGGGSTELVLGSTTPPAVLAAHSMDVGCVRMTERHLHSDPPRPAEIEATVRDLRAALAAAAADVPFARAQAFVGVAGTVTTIVAIALGLPGYDPVAIHGATISFDQVSAVTERLVRMTRGERAALPVMHPGRVDVIGGGALVLRTVMECLGATEVIASEHDILDGIALSLG